MNTMRVGAEDGKSLVPVDSANSACPALWVTHLTDIGDIKREVPALRRVAVSPIPRATAVPKSIMNAAY
jgi:hypothetical protein